MWCRVVRDIGLEFGFEIDKTEGLLLIQVDLRVFSPPLGHKGRVPLQDSGVDDWRVLHMIPVCRIEPVCATALNLKHSHESIQMVMCLVL